MRFNSLRLLLILSLSFSVLALPANVQAQVQSASKQSFDLEKVRSYLSGFKKIRVGISRAPGNGHQSAGATVVNRLRQLGYDGEIQVVYQSSVKESLGFLLPPFNPAGENEQNFPEKKLSFTDRFSSPSGEGLEEMELGIMGADDRAITPALLNVKMLLKLQPLDWYETPTLILRGKRAIFLQDLKHLGYVFEIPRPVNPAEFIAAEMSKSCLSYRRIRI